MTFTRCVSCGSARALSELHRARYAPSVLVGILHRAKYAPTVIADILRRAREVLRVNVCILRLGRYVPGALDGIPGVLLCCALTVRSVGGVRVLAGRAA